MLDQGPQEKMYGELICLVIDGSLKKNAAQIWRVALQTYQQESSGNTSMGSETHMLTEKCERLKRDLFGESVL